MNTILLLQPQPYDAVGKEFVLCGLIPTSWLMSDSGKTNHIYLDQFDANAKPFQGGTIPVPAPGFFGRILGRAAFTYRVSYNSFSIGWLLPSHGLILLKLSGNQPGQVMYIPVEVKGPWSSGVTPDQVDKHKRLSERLQALERASDSYDRELEELHARRELATQGISNDEECSRAEIDVTLVDDLFRTIESVEDEELLNLNRKYSEAIEWEPRFGGTVGAQNGFVYTAFSNDHGPHFHVVHRGRGINARFSFPAIELLSYKEIGDGMARKEIRAVQEFFRIPSNKTRMAKELAKRIDA